MKHSLLQFKKLFKKKYNQAIKTIEKQINAYSVSFIITHKQQYVLFGFIQDYNMGRGGEGGVRPSFKKNPEWYITPFLT